MAITAEKQSESEALAIQFEALEPTRLDKLITPSFKEEQGPYLGKWELRSESSVKAQGSCKSSDEFLKIRFHPPVVFVLKAAFRVQKVMNCGFPRPAAEGTQPREELARIIIFIYTITPPHISVERQGRTRLQRRANS